MNNPVVLNKKALHDYTVVERMECGINLIGCEVKSVRMGQLNLTDSYCTVKDGQLILNNCYIKNYDKGSFSNVDGRRDRRLLAHKREIMRLLGKVREKRVFCLFLCKIYFKQSLVKVEVALVKGKHLYDKKQSLMEKDIERDKQRALKEYSGR